MNWLRTTNRVGCVPLADIPVADYGDFRAGVCELLARRECHVAEYFAVPSEGGLRFFILLADDASGEVLISSHAGDGPLESLTAAYPAMHPFEREIAERHHVVFIGNPWEKPLRGNPDEYPFYRMEGDSLHEVNVGPIHAGVIEPGAFRFICNGERVLNLEIALGYQHRGIEELIRSAGSGLKRTLLAESIAGDTVVGHTTAHAMVAERLLGRIPGRNEEIQRAVALELERIAIHLGDISALCGDVAYQLGQVACEALRTIAINTTQRICGNRFGKGLVRPCGSDIEISADLAAEIIKNVTDISHRTGEVLADLKNSPSLLSRFEECGTVTLAQAARIGAVGVAARASGLLRDLRATHPWGPWGEGIEHTPITHEYGDVMSRLTQRAHEIQQSAHYVQQLLALEVPEEGRHLPMYEVTYAPATLAFALVEGWRGEICHAAVTDTTGTLAAYKIKDPSMHNWLALSLAVRGGSISDFPVCNKSFNLSYCGHDL